MNDSEQEFERLVREYKSTIYSVCYMLAEDRPEADDLFQETMINLWHGRKSLRNSSAQKSWIYRVALNTCISCKRKKRVATARIVDSAPEISAETLQEERQSQLLHDRISRLGILDRAIVFAVA